MPSAIDSALVDRALAAADVDGNTYWGLVTDLHRRGGPEVFGFAMGLGRHADPRHRELGVDILAQLDYELPEEKRPSRKATITFLAELMATERHAGVLRACGSAFGHLGDHGNPESLIACRTHPDATVREKVAIGIRPWPDDVRALDALLELSHDPVARVREWPLLWFSDADVASVPQVHARLVEALKDPDLTCRAEAMCGLATQRHPGLGALISAELAAAPPDADNYGLGRLRDAQDDLLDS